ncbi:MAG: metallophosphatase family protein [Anaerolineae bacterium]|nr:metallophosphatase family protein [Anaerolineae bacterium]
MTARPITLGLISDTHMPDRWRTLPPAVFDTFADVDLILHAGDVGELWVLDELSARAPVIAVHGNDDSPAATRELPYQQLITIAGQRILLTHGHYPDRAEEMANRKIDAWEPKLKRWGSFAQRTGASILIYGHTHIAFDVLVDGVRVINPGAIAAGNHLARQTVQSVARLTIPASGTPSITYTDLNAPERDFTPIVDLSAGFLAALQQVSEPIAPPELLAHRNWVMQELLPLAPEPLLNALRRVMFRCLDGEIPMLTLDVVLTEFHHAPDIPDVVKQKLAARWPDFGTQHK